MKNKLTMHQVVFWLCLVTSVGLCIAGFIIPPCGVIDGSVLTAVGELLGFATLAQLPLLLKKHSFQISHGDTTVSVNDNKQPME